MGEMIIQVIKKNGDQISKKKIEFFDSYGKSGSGAIPIFLTPWGRYLAYAENPCFLPGYDTNQAKNYNQIRLNIFEIIIDPNAEEIINLKLVKTVEWFDEQFWMQGGIDSFYTNYVVGTIFISDNLDIIRCDTE